MVVRSTEIREIIQQEIERFGQELTVTNGGTVVEGGDGMGTVYGLRSVMASELVECERGVPGIALNLREERLGVVIMGEYTGTEEGE